MRSIEEPSMANLKLFFSNIWNIYLLKNTIWKVNQGWVGTGNSRDETRQDTETKIWIQEKARQQRCISRQVKIFKCSEIWFQDKSRHSNFWKPRDKTGQDSISCLVSAGKSGQDWILRSKSMMIFHGFGLKTLLFKLYIFHLMGRDRILPRRDKSRQVRQDNKWVQDKSRH